MDTSRILAKDRFGFVGILREALRISTTSPSFLILAFLSSFPLFCSLLLNEFLLQQTSLDTAQTSRLALMSALYLVIVNPLDLLNTALVVHRGLQSLPCTRFCSVALSLLGLLSLASNLYGSSSYFGPAGFSKVLSGLLFVALFKKYTEWSAIWNVGFVISILEEKHGDIALGVAAYLSRGSRRKGFALMLAGLVATIMQVSLVCLGNVVKWSVFMVYYCDCKKRFLEKKIDVKEGKAAQLVKS
ncbi:hypothetical protein ACJRO7_035365 [Eucalyptus globulus]|uniref:Uncharacterized protein n=1 Tax=Eucalyptus globulus TaxID=34317 RepID=A0ABD3J8N3_EUCGL